MSKLSEIESAMVEHFEAHVEKAGVGLELLPGIRELLEAMQVRGEWGGGGGGGPLCEGEALGRKRAAAETEVEASSSRSEEQQQQK